ncbi:hypothetical protein HanRHA438_Chr01g0017141 [Helianthus annuus]|nr:hypothetical protein HanRHA438_Chr01g0017141 [Helianthus annuus]
MSTIRCNCFTPYITTHVFLQILKLGVYMCSRLRLSGRHEFN